MEAGGRSNLATVSQTLVSGLGLLFSAVSAVLLGLVGLSGLLGEIIPLPQIVPLFTTAWISALAAGLAIPSLILCALRLSGRASVIPTPFNLSRLAWIMVLLWPLILLLGNAVATLENIAWLLLPPLHLLAIGLPIWWLVELARSKLPAGSQQRQWGILNVSLFVTTPSVVIIEFIAVIALILLAAAAISSRPEWVAEIERLAQRINPYQVDPEEILRLAQPLLQNPLAIFSILAVLAGLIPLIEELIKPLGVWFLAGRNISPAEGFAAGAISGGAFALLESLLTLAGPQGEGWASLAVARAGTGLLHITTTALVGWGLASAWRSASYLRLAGAYLLAVLIHGLWNALSVFFGLGTLLESPPAGLAWLVNAGELAPIGLGVLLVVIFALLLLFNRGLRKQYAAGLPADLSGPISS